MNGFTRSLDRKIEASKRRQAEEQRGQASSKAPTQGLTDLASTANNNIPARQPMGKPPIGLVPAAYCDKGVTVLERLHAVRDAISRRDAAGLDRMPEWEAERDQLTYWCSLDSNRVSNWILERAIKEFTRTILPGGRNITSVAYKVERPGQVFERVVFDPPITVQEGDIIEMRSGAVHVTRDMIADSSPTLNVGIRNSTRETIEVTPGRAALPVDQICTVAEAMDRLKLAMQQDPDYARTWHDNIAMAFVDGMRWTDEALGLSEPDQYMLNHTRRAANRAAVHLMDMAFQADTSKHAASLRNKADFWDNLANARPLHTKIVKNTAIAGSLDAQLAAAKAAEPDILGAIQTIEQRERSRPAVTNLLAEMADDIERMLRIPPEAPGGLNEMKSRALERMGFGSTIFRRADGNEAVKADLSDANSMTITRELTTEEADHIIDKALIGQPVTLRFPKDVGKL